MSTPSCYGSSTLGRLPFAQPRDQLKDIIRRLAIGRSANVQQLARAVSAVVGRRPRTKGFVERIVHPVDEHSRTDRKIALADVRVHCALEKRYGAWPLD